MNVIVVGGGIAGTVAAIALRQRTGTTVRLYERRPRPDADAGAFLSLAVNALRGLDAVGLRGAVSEAGFEVDNQYMWNGAGRALGKVPRGRAADDPWRSITLRRKDLVSVLHREAARQGVETVTGAGVVDVRQHADNAEVVLADGASVAADLVVAADGIWSVARRTVAPTAEKPRYAGMVSIAGVSRRWDGLPEGFHIVFARCGAFVCVPAPDGTIWWAAQPVVSPQPADLSAADFRAWPSTLQRRYVDDRMVREVLDQTIRIEHATAHHTMTPILDPVTDTIALIGDAAHPVGSGQGAAMAIEDAVLLADRVAGRRSVPEALREFADKRRDRVARVLATADQNSEAKTAGPVKRRMRDLVMPVVVPRFYGRATDWLHDYDVSAETGAASR